VGFCLVPCKKRCAHNQHAPAATHNHHPSTLTIVRQVHRAKRHADRIATHIHVDMLRACAQVVRVQATGPVLLLAGCVGSDVIAYAVDNADGVTVVHVAPENGSFSHTITRGALAHPIPSRVLAPAACLTSRLSCVCVRVCVCVCVCLCVCVLQTHPVRMHHPSTHRTQLRHPPPTESAHALPSSRVLGQTHTHTIKYPQSNTLTSKLTSPVSHLIQHR
jgi:hypothetical protein